MDKLKSTLGSRKFLITVLIIGGSITMFMTNHITIDQMAEMIKWSAGTYVGSLGIEDASKHIGKLLK